MYCRKVLSALDVLILPMRDWNITSGNLYSRLHSSFWSYLWGIEIRLEKILNRRKKLFWSYLWGIEIEDVKQSGYINEKFWSYLWGIEIKIDFHTHVSFFLCFDLTYEGLKSTIDGRTVMSNLPFWSYLWGIEMYSAAPIGVYRICFDLTYEGLKYFNAFSMRRRFLRVLILPMRDWNYISSST